MEIYKMLTINANHIKRETWYLLAEDHDSLPIPYRKEYMDHLYGFFIPIGDIYVLEECEDVAPDLAECMEFALDQECEWLCIDVDGEEVSELPIYKWHD